MPALRAAGQATLVLQRTGNLSVSVIVGQIRSTAVDLLRSTGISYDDAAEAVRAAAQDEERLAHAAASPAGSSGTSTSCARRSSRAPRRCRSAGSAPRGAGGG